MSKSIKIAILGATGIVGQKVITLLQTKKNINIIELLASNKNINHTFGEVCNWREQSIKLPKNIANIKLASVNNIKSKFIISCLPSKPAQKIESILLKYNKIIFSNASSFRMNTNVPIIIPEINLKHLSLLKYQNFCGRIITNPNCSVSGIALTLAPLMKIKIKHVSIVTLQSISGAGYSGISALDIINNTIPHIDNEEEKIIEETKKILGNVKTKAQFSITVSAHRVPVIYGHTITMHIHFADTIYLNKIIKYYTEWNKKYNDLFIFYNELNRPQAVKDLKNNNGMSIHIGKIQIGEKNNILKIIILVHNLIRGAAGAVIANLENYLNIYKK